MLQDMKSVFDRGLRPFQLIRDFKYCNTFCLQFDERASRRCSIEASS
jgi:hypothetical protein